MRAEGLSGTPQAPRSGRSGLSIFSRSEAYGIEALPPHGEKIDGPGRSLTGLSRA